jgi:hypothetical protein
VTDFSAAQAVSDLALIQNQPTKVERPMLAKIEDSPAFQQQAQEPETMTLHCFDPWTIVKAKPNQEAKAKESLMREGFEVYYGERIKFVTVTIPAKKISSKNRHKRRSEYVVVERPQPVYPGYLFCRRMWGGFDLWRCWDLPGCLGMCCFGLEPATVHDYTIELLRLAEARGSFRDDDGWRVQLDTSCQSSTPRDIRAAEKARNAPERPKKERKELKRLDEPSRSVLFVEELGRITRIVTSHEAAKSGAKDGVPPQVRSLKEFW